MHVTAYVQMSGDIFWVFLSFTVRVQGSNSGSRLTLLSHLTGPCCWKLKRKETLENKAHSVPESGAVSQKDIRT